MRTSPLVVSLVLLAAFSADLVRRVVAAVGGEPTFAFPQATRSQMIAAQGSHESRIDLESHDGTTSTLRITVTPGAGTEITEVVVEQASLGGKAPLEGLPHRVVPAGPGAIEIRLRFRDVRWEPARFGESGYEAHAERKLRVLYSGCVPADAKIGSEGGPLTVSEGPVLEQLQKQLGGK